MKKEKFAEMFNHRKVLTILILVMIIPLSACYNIVPTSAPTQMPGLLGTLAAQTMMANAELKALLMTATPTKTVELPPPTSLPVNINQPIPSRTPVPSLTPIIPFNPLSTPLSAIIPPCNQAEFIQDVTIPDDTVMAPGTKFTKIWQLKNVGSCTWTTEYSVTLIWGDKMGTNPPIPLQQEVTPGALVDIAIDMIAPNYGDCFQSNWMLQDPSGVIFGTGANGKGTFWVAISVWSQKLGKPVRVG